MMIKNVIKFFVAAFLIVVGSSFIIASFLMPSTEVEVSLPLPISIFAEVKNGRIVIRGTEADAWIVEFSLGVALVITGVLLAISSVRV